jgi:hypothetical protein
MSRELSRRTRVSRSGGVALLLTASTLAAGPAFAADESKSTMDVYGFIMLDTGYQVNQNDPDWFDVVRPTKLPSFENEFGADGNWFFSVRQTRFGVKTSTPTDMGDLKTQFEFELFGTGSDAGQTTFRLRHAYAELGQWGAGQTVSPFMDIDIFPNSIEYWGPTGMVFFRNVQLRWMPIQGDTRLTVALERPGASGDQGEYADRVELSGITPHFPYPDISAEYRMGFEWGYAEVAGIVRWIELEDNLADAFDLSAEELGWGINVTSNINLGKTVLRLGVVYGEGVQNYMNDAPADVGPRNNFGNPTRPIEAELLPLLGISAFVDINWSEKMTSTVGYSLLDIDNSDGQTADAFKHGDYALANVLFYPTKNVMFGPELQYGRRENARDGFSSDDVRIQFSVKVNFGRTFGGN